MATHLTEKQKYFHLVAEVCEQLSPTAVDKALRAGHPMPVISLNNVRTGRKIDLPALVLMITLGLPNYRIPEHLQPASELIP